MYLEAHAMLRGATFIYPNLEHIKAFRIWEQNVNAVKYVFFANTVLIQIQYFLDQISVLLLSLSKFSIAWNRRGFRQIYQARVLKLMMMIGFVLIKLNKLRNWYGIKSARATLVHTTQPPIELAL